jgi:hypothetical protein
MPENLLGAVDPLSISTSPYSLIRGVLVALGFFRGALNGIIFELSFPDIKVLFYFFLFQGCPAFKKVAKFS